MSIHRRFSARIYPLLFGTIQAGLFCFVLLLPSVACRKGMELPSDWNERLNIRDPRDKERREQRDLLIGFYFLFLEPEPVDPPGDCNSWNPIPNPAYFHPAYGTTFANDLDAHETVIIGDSTVDYYKSNPGYVTKSDNLVQVVAVLGNTLCDMIRQLPSIKAPAPTNIVISSAGGNDLLRKYTVSQVSDAGTVLLNRIRSRFPITRITMVGVHPTFNSHLNSNKADTNLALRSHLLSLGNSCWVDPLPLFGVSEGNEPFVDDMQDSIHYSKTMALKMKNRIETVCGVFF